MIKKTPGSGNWFWLALVICLLVPACSSSPTIPSVIVTPTSIPESPNDMEYRFRNAIQYNNLEGLVNLFRPEEREQIKKELSQRTELLQRVRTMAPNEKIKTSIDLTFLKQFRAQESQQTFVIEEYHAYIVTKVGVTWLVISSFGSTSQSEEFYVVLPLVYEQGHWYITRTINYQIDDAIKEINFLEGDEKRVNHVMDPEHEWGRLVPLGKNQLENYRAIRPIIASVIKNYQATLTPDPSGGTVYTYQGTYNGQTIVVTLYEKDGAISISNAYIQTK